MNEIIKQFLNNNIELIDDDTKEFFRRTELLSEGNRDTLLVMLNNSGIPIMWDIVFPDYPNVHYFEYDTEQENEQAFGEYVLSWETSLQNPKGLTVAEIMDNYYELNDRRKTQVNDYYDDSNIVPDYVGIEINVYNGYGYVEIHMENPQEGSELYISSNREVGTLSHHGFALIEESEIRTEVEMLKDLWKQIT